MPNYVVTSRADISVGAEIDIRFADGTGRGGKVTAIGPDMISMVCGTGRVPATYTTVELIGAAFYLTVPFPASDCDRFSSECKGTVDWRMKGRMCDHHWTERCNVINRIRGNYPDSPIAPSWFDPSYAGESWNEDY